MTHPIASLNLITRIHSDLTKGTIDLHGLYLAERSPKSIFLFGILVTATGTILSCAIYLICNKVDEL
jgi:hypothetical protein